MTAPAYTIDGKPDPKQAARNARIEDAAYDLLRACKRLVAVVDELHDGSHATQMALNAARDAIRKAE